MILHKRFVLFILVLIIYGLFALIIKKFGIKILGSPFEGWFTPDMGFIWLSNFNINEVLKEVAKYSFNVLGCWYVQISDKKITTSSLDSSIYYVEYRSLEIDLSIDSEDIFNNFHKSAKKRIKQFDNRGAIIKRVPFDREFVDVFYSQITDVFAKQRLLPNYDIKKIYDMADALKDNPELVFATQVYDPDGTCIASSIYLGFNEWCYSLATASYRSGQWYLPNEKCRWLGMCYWKDKGATSFDMVGFREYKMKFSPEVVMRPTVIFTKFKALLYLKKLAQSLVILYRKARGKFYESTHH